MPIDTKNKNKQKQQYNDRVTTNVRDYGNEPFFIKKAENSKKRLEKVGFPKELVDQK